MCADAFVEGSAIHFNVAGVTVFQRQNIYINIKKNIYQWCLYFQLEEL